VRSGFLTTLALTVLFAACEGSHTDLGVTPTTAATGSSGSTGGNGDGAGNNTGGGPTVTEPDLPPKLTLVHGVIDQPAIQFCFLASPADAADAAEPFPEEPLDYARSVAFALPSDPIPEAGNVEVVVLAGELASVGALGCRELADDPSLAPDAIVQSLGVVPREALDMQRSLLLVPTGCFAFGHEDPLLEEICGEAYTADTPSPNVVLAPMSRVVDFGSIGLQAVHAIGGTPLEIDTGVVPTLTPSERTIGDDVTFGEVSPFPPNTALSASELEGPSSAVIRTYLAPGGVISAEILLGSAMTNGGITAEDFKNGTNVVLLGIGPTPGTPGGSWWNEFTYVALRADP
jgi:hypothetical protein